MELDALEDEVTPQRVRLLEARLKVHFGRIQELENSIQELRDAYESHKELWHEA